MKKAKSKPLTVQERVDWGTDNSVELTGSYLGATPDNPGGCQTFGVVMLRGGCRIISGELLAWLVKRAERADELEQSKAREIQR